MEMRPVRALPVFLYRGLFFCGSGKFPKRPGAPQWAPMAEARDNARDPCVRIRHIPIHNEGDGDLFAPLPIIVTAKHSDPFIVTFLQATIVTSIRAK